jgi:hypothetical protein
MSHLLGDLHFVSVYVNDIVIYSNTIEERLEHVKIVIERPTKAKLIINKEKSNFFRMQVVLLGLLVDSNGKRTRGPILTKLPISRRAPPTNDKMVQRYLGMFNYFREYIPLYGTVSAPLDRLRNVRGDLTLDDLEMRCFEQLRRLITEAPVLSFAALLRGNGSIQSWHWSGPLSTTQQASRRVQGQLHLIHGKVAKAS